MDINQLAKLLQLGGFLLASVFGGILLDEAAGGKVAEGFKSLFVGFAERLRKLMQKLGKNIIKIEEPEGPVGLIAISFFWIGSLTLLMIGWFKHIPVVLWSGVGLYSMYAVFFLLVVPGLVFVPRIQTVLGFRLTPIRNGQLLSAKEFLSEYALMAPFLVSGIILPLALIPLFISYFLKVSGSTMKILANPKVPKTAFTVLGYVMLLAGLIIDTIAAF